MDNKKWGIIVLIVVVVLAAAYYFWGKDNLGLQETGDNNQEQEGQTPSPTPTPPGGAAAVRVRVISPNGGDTWVRGSQYNVKWDTAGIPSDSRVYVDLIPTTSVITNPYANSRRITGQEMFNVAIFPDASPPEGSYSYTVPQGVKTGTYQVLILAGKDCNLPATGVQCKYDLSDGLITIK